MWEGSDLGFDEFFVEGRVEDRVANEFRGDISIVEIGFFKWEEAEYAVGSAA